MDSIVGFDPTLPLDLDGSSNPDHLPEVTFGNHLEYQDGSIPMVTKQNNGRMSPIRARTMKEYDQQIAELKKENFSLKLRIYFLEERMQQKFGDGDVFKTNIELKVQVESLKKELMDKHELLKKASTAMESLTSNHEMEMNRLCSQIEQEKNKESSGLHGQLSEAQQKIGQLEMEKQGLELELQKAEDMEKKYTTELGDYKKLLLTRDKEKAKLEADLEAGADQTRTLADRLKEKDEELERLAGQSAQLQKELDRRDRDMNQLSYVLKEEKAMSSDSFLANSHLQDKVDDQRHSLDKLQVKIGQLQNELGQKEDSVGKLEDALRNLDKKYKDQQLEVEKMRAERVRQDENRLKRDKTIQGLVAALHEKNNETKTLEDLLGKSREEVTKLQEHLHEARMAKHKDLMRALGKKDGELCNFKDLLCKAEDALKKSDTAVESLHAQLQKEREEVKDRLDNQAQHYKRLLEDAQSEVKLKGDLLRTVEDRLKDKDKQLQEYVSLLSEDGQTDITDLHKNITDKNAELRNLKQRLAVQDRNVEDLKHQLQTAEDTMAAMDDEGKAKDDHIRQLTGKLRTAQRELEAAVDGQMRANEDRSRAVKHLEGLLADKDAALQDALEYNSSDGSRLKLLRDQLREKDKLLEELMAEKNRSVLDGEQANRELISKLKEKNGSTDDMKLYRLLEEQLQEIRHLSELLMKEKQIFITLNQDRGGTGSGGGEGSTSARQADTNQDRSSAFLTELAAVQALRQQLQEGVERNNNLRLVLEHQITGQTAAPAPAPGQAPAPANANAHASASGGFSCADKEYRSYDQHPHRQADSSPEWDQGLRSHGQSRSSQRESGYHEFSDHDHRGTQISPGCDQHLPNGQTYKNRVISNPHSVGTPPRPDHHSVQTSPFTGVSTQSRSTATSPQCRYRSVHTSPICLDRNLSPSSESENNLPHRYDNTSPNRSGRNLSLKRSSHINFHDAQTSPIATLNGSFSPNSSLSSGLGTAASGIDTESLSKMSSSMLRKLVQQLQEDLVGALKQNHELQDQVFGECGMREIPGRNDTDPTMADFQQMQKQVEDLRLVLDKRSKENEMLRSHLGLDQTAQLDVSSLPYLNDLENEVHMLKVQLKDVRHANDLLKKQINLSSQSEDYPSGFNPTLIVDMAKEIEALKAELEKSRKQIAEQRRVTFDNQQGKKGRKWNGDVDAFDIIDGASNSSEMNSVSQSSSGHSVRSGGMKMSQIPILKPRGPMTSNTTHENHPLILQTQLKEAKEQIKQLENTLAATEETVRYQSQKVKYYRSLLKDAGIVPLQDSRSQSETCLTKLSGQRSWRGSMENLSPARNIHDALSAYRNVSLESVKDYGNTDNVYELKHQIKDMQSKLEKSFSLVHRYQSASPSSDRGASPVRRSPSANGRLTFSSDNISQLCQMSGSLEKLQKQVRSLESELQESRTLNTELQGQLRDLQTYRSTHNDQSTQALELEISSLRKQLLNSQNVNIVLKNELEELSQFLSELMVHDQNGHTSNHVGLSDVSNIREKLDHSLDVLRTTSELSVCDSNLGTASMSSIGVTSDINLQDKYQEVLHSNQQLRKQFAQLQDMYRNDLHNKSHEIQQLQKVSEMFQKELESSGKSKHSGEADGSPVANRRLSGRKKSDTETLDSSSPCDGVPHPSLLHLNPAMTRVSGTLVKSGSMESDDIADIHKQTDENYGRPLKDSSGDSSMERMRHRTGSGSPNKDGESKHNVEDSVDRLRHRTLSGVTSFSHAQPSLDGQFVGDSTVFSNSPGVPERSFHRTISDREGVDFTVYSNTSVGGLNCDVTLPPERDECRDLVNGRRLHFKMFDCETETASSRERSETPNPEMSQLQARLHAMEDLNMTLKGELSIYEDLYKSMGIQASPNKSHAHNHSHSRTNLDDLTLKQHLAEIRNMRLRLEEGLDQNDKIRDDLLNKLENSEGMRGHMDCDKKVHELELTIKQLQHDLNSKQACISEKIFLIDEREKIIQDTKVIIKKQRKEAADRETMMEKLRQDLSKTQSVLEKYQTEMMERERIIADREKTVTDREQKLLDREQKGGERDQKLHTLQQKKEKMETMLKKASKEIKRLNFELLNLREKEAEKTELNKSLRVELSVYEKLRGNQKENDEKSCVHELLLEVQRLRRQLERSIDSNGLLRAKLEEILEHQEKRHSQQHINSPTYSHTTDAPDGRPSPESTLRAPPEDEAKTKETYIRKFHSEKEYKFNVMTREAGLHGEADHIHSDFTSTSESHNVHVRSTRDSSAEKPSTSPNQDARLSRSYLMSSNADVSKGSSMMSLPDDLGQRSNRRHLASMENLKYWVDSTPAEAMKDFPVVRIDSDIRRLFAIGKIDDYEKLRKENNETLVVLASIQARVGDRLKTLKTQPISENVDYSTLKEIEMSTHNLQICLKEEKRLISSFWLSQLPPINELGEFFDPKLASENGELKESLVKLRAQYDLSKMSLREANERLKATNKQRADMEEVLYKQLSKTYKVLERAETNLEKSTKESGLKIPPTSSTNRHRSSRNKPL